MPVRGGNDLAHVAAERRVRIRVEDDARPLSGGNARDVRLVHVHVDLEAREVGHRHDRAPRQPPTHRRRHHLAYLGFLAEHGAGERRADLGVVEIHPRKSQRRLGSGDLGSRRSHSRCRRCGARFRRVDFLQRHQLRILRADVSQPARVPLLLVVVCLCLDRARSRASEIGGGLCDLRLVIRVLEPRDHSPTLDERSFGDAEVGQPSRDLGGDGRPRAGDDVAVGGHAGSAARAG